MQRPRGDGGPDGAVWNNVVVAWPGERDGHLPLISTTPPTRADCVLGAGVVVALVGALAATAPHANVPLPGSTSLIAAYLVAVLINQLVTAVLLFGLYAVQESRPILILAVGYLLAGLLIIPWALTFPGAFPSLGIGSGLQSTATIAALNRLVFPICVLAYALSRDRPGSRRSIAATIAATVAIVLAAVAGLSAVVLFTDAPLPPFMRDAQTVAPLWHAIPPLALAICVTGVAVLAVRLRSVMDLWLMVVLVSLVIEIVLLGYLSGGVRLSLGWWAGRLYGLVAASTVLVVLLSATTTLYARLARSVLAERRAREARQTVMEAVSASIAHELKQPLASVELSAAAALRWLRRDPPDLREVEIALQRIEAVGERGGRIVDTIRTFRTGGAQRMAVDVNTVIREVFNRCGDEAAVDRVSVRCELDEGPVTVIIDPLQLQLVLSNLICNALDAMSTVAGRPRMLRVSSHLTPGEVVISVADTGVGLHPAHREQIFSAFFTTKKDGMGVGLMFCRTIAHTSGGRIWATDNVPHGAVFHFALPSAVPTNGAGTGTGPQAG